MGQHTKFDTVYLPPKCDKFQLRGVQPDWVTHPSWIAGVEALDAYSHWVSGVVLPIAFQWIEEHKPDVYATVPDEYKDDVGVVIAAAFKLVKDLSAYQKGLVSAAAYEAALANGTWDPSTINPVWTGIVEKVRASTEEAFAEQSSLLGDPNE